MLVCVRFSEYQISRINTGRQYPMNGISYKVGNFTYKCYRISKEYLIKRLLLCNDAQEVLNGISNKL